MTVEIPSIVVEVRSWKYQEVHEILWFPLLEFFPLHLVTLKKKAITKEDKSKCLGIEKFIDFLLILSWSTCTPLSKLIEHTLEGKRRYKGLCTCFTFWTSLHDVTSNSLSSLPFVWTCEFSFSLFSLIIIWSLLVPLVWMVLGSRCYRYFEKWTCWYGHHGEHAYHTVKAFLTRHGLPP